MRRLVTFNHHLINSTWKFIFSKEYFLIANNLDGFLHAFITQKRTQIRQIIKIYVPHIFAFYNQFPHKGLLKNYGTLKLFFFKPLTPYHYTSSQIITRPPYGTSRLTRIPPVSFISLFEVEKKPKDMHILITHPPMYLSN